MAQQSEYDTHNKSSNIFTITDTKSVGRDSPGSGNENANDSATYKHNSALSNEPNTSLSISSIESEFIKTLAPTDSTESGNGDAINSATYMHNSALANKSNTNVSISSIDSESISTLEGISYKADFAHMPLNNGDNMSTISPDQTIPEDDTNVYNSDITKIKT